MLIFYYSMLAIVYFALGVFLLWLPLPFLRPTSLKLASFEQRAWPKGGWAFLQFLDIVRAAVGAWLLHRHVGAVPFWAGEGKFELTALAGFLAVGFAIQTLTWRDEDWVFSPIVYTIGVVVGALQPILVLPVLLLGLGSVWAFRAWSLMFIGAALATVLGGLMHQNQNLMHAFCLGIALCTPSLVSLLAGRHMGWPRRYLGLEKLAPLR
jgi:hypothetical protein